MALEDYIYNKPTVITDRLVIGPMTASDADALGEWISHPQMSEFRGIIRGCCLNNKPEKSFHLGIAEKVPAAQWMIMDL